MSIIGFLDQDLFVIRLIKHLTTNPDNSWANSYEFRATDDGISSVLFDLGDALVAFEAAIHSQFVQFDRYTISTWEPDSVPYDPTVFVSIPLSQFGQDEVLDAELEPLGMAWRVNRQPASGRFGNLFYRGCLFETNVEAPAGIPVLADPPSMSALLQDAIDSSLLANYFGSAPTGGMQMVMINFDGDQIRPVNQLISGGVSLIKQDHQWFNRTTGEPSARGAKRVQNKRAKPKQP